MPRNRPLPWLDSAPPNCLAEDVARPFLPSLPKAFFLAFLLWPGLMSVGETLPTLPLPPRPPQAPTGSELAAALRDLSLARREERLFWEIAGGNVPDFFRALYPVTVTNSATTKPVTIWVTPDYLAVGHDTNFLRVPLTPMTAQRLADRLGCALPSPGLADAIWRAAKVQLDPEPMPPGPTMTTVTAFLEHHNRIERQRAGRGGLLAGHKKDVVFVPGATNRVAIYGWHRTNGQPIQPLYTRHAATWVDYSHGIRLVWNEAMVNGRRVPLTEACPETGRYPTNWPTAPDPEPTNPRATNSFGEIEWDFPLEPEIRVRLNLPPPAPAAINDLLVFFLLPNGNTIEQAAGRRPRDTNEWRFDLQHIAAQTRFARAALPNTRIAVAYLEAGGRSWPAWRRRHGNALLPEVVERVRARFDSRPTDFLLTAHSGGGSLLFGWLQAVAQPPPELRGMVFLDANYAYERADHFAKLRDWLESPTQPRLLVLAYEDYVAQLAGRPFVSAEGGTWGRSQRMREDLGQVFVWQSETNGPLQTHRALAGRVEFRLRENPERKIWHTVLVERNGFLHALLMGTPAEGRNYEWLGPRAYEAFIATE